MTTNGCNCSVTETEQRQPCEPVVRPFRLKGISETYKGMINIVKKGKLIYFAVYCALAGTFAILWHLFA